MAAKNLKPMAFVISTLLVVMPLPAQLSDDEQRVREAVQSFYADFSSHRWEDAAKYTTDDWVHINPLGGWTRGRDAVLKELEEVHSTFLKGVSDTIEQVAVKFATPDVAVATVSSRMSTFTTPDGVKHEREQHIRTFVLVKQKGRWLILHDQNTAVSR